MKLANNIINIDPNAKAEIVKDDAELSAMTSIRDLEGDVDNNDPQLPEYSTDPNENQHLRSTIDVSVDLLQRLYSGLYIIQNVITSRFVGMEEGEHLAHELIQQKLIVPLSFRFPDMNEFEFNVKLNHNGMTIEGTNTFSATLINAIHQSTISPVEDTPDPFLESGYDYDE